MGILRDTYIVNNNTDTSRISYKMSRKNDIEESQKQKEVIDKLKHILNNQMNYREFVDIVNDIEDVLKEVSE